MTKLNYNLMQTASSLIINSLNQLEKLHAQLIEWQSTATAIPYQPEIIFSSSITEINGNRGYVYINDVCLKVLLEVVRILGCRRLTLINVIVSGATVFIRGTLEDLREVHMQDCPGAIPLIRQFIVKCPNLERFSDNWFKETYIHPQDEQDCVDKMVMTVIAITASCSQNYHLRGFQSLSIDSELKALMQTRIKQADRLRLQEYSRTVRNIPRRNLAGFRKCQAAVYQFLLIKRYRRKSVLRIINKDVVKLIAQLIYNSRGTKIWCS